MEQEILTIIKNMCYSDRLKELYDNREKNIEFPLKFSLPPNYKVLADFSDEYFFKYENILVENAVINAILNNEKNYLEFFYQNMNELSEILDNDITFRIKTCELAIKNIISKLMLNINYDEKIKNDNKEIFNKIENVYTFIEPITFLYRKIIMNFLGQANEEDKDVLLDGFLTTNNFDKYIFKSSNTIINNENIKYFKSLLIRLILSDNYLHIESIIKEEDLNKEIKDINQKFNDLVYGIDDLEFENDYEEEKDEIDEIDEDKSYDETNNNIIEYIESCIKTKKYILPEDITLRFNIYSRFISYNLYLASREYDFKTIEEDKEKVLKLKKINPLYKFELKDY